MGNRITLEPITKLTQPGHMKPIPISINAALILSSMLTRYQA